MRRQDRERELRRVKETTEGALHKLTWIIIIANETLLRNENFDLMWNSQENSFIYVNYNYGNNNLTFHKQLHSISHLNKRMSEKQANEIKFPIKFAYTVTVTLKQDKS